MNEKMVEEVRHDFTPEELNQLRDELASKTLEVESLKAERLATATALRGRIEAVQKDIHETANKIAQRYELRETELLVLMDTPRMGVKRIVIAETSQTLREEPMTLREQQEVFKFEPEPEPESGEDDGNA